MICADADCLVTGAVRGELQRRLDAHPALREALYADWTESVGFDDLGELGTFAEYALLPGSSRASDVGEAVALAWATTHDALLFVDDAVHSYVCYRTR